MLSFDYALTANMLVGARLGMTLFKYPGEAAYSDGRAWNVASGRLYLDARFTYLFGENAINKTVAPMVFAGLGAASFDTTRRLRDHAEQRSERDGQPLADQRAVLPHGRRRDPRGLLPELRRHRSPCA